MKFKCNLRVIKKTLDTYSFEKKSAYTQALLVNNSNKIKN